VPELVVNCFVSSGGIREKVTHLSTVEAWKVAGGSLLWWLDCSLLQQWNRSMVELLLLLWQELPLLVLWVIAHILLLLRSVQLPRGWGIHYVVV
jgi:hypothetical protein